MHCKRIEGAGTERLLCLVLSAAVVVLKQFLQLGLQRLVVFL